MSVRHFLRFSDLNRSEVDYLLRRAQYLKTMRRARTPYRPLVGYALAMVFEKSSTRTRVSFEVAMGDFGGQALFLSPRDTQLGRGEPIEDSARVLSRLVDLVMIRTFAHAKIETFARYATVPVVNGLTDRHHPCQVLADVLTYQELRGGICGRTVAWVGDGNNMCNSYIDAAKVLGFDLRIACPAGYEPPGDLVAEAGARATVTRDPRAAVEAADLVVTDVWASMGQEEEAAARAEVFAPYQVSAALFGLARPDALFMHCLPAHRGEEVSAEVLEHERSVVWEEAGNRLHAQKALIELLLLGPQ
jgi:ornithine carbamoyltransferase